MRDFAFAAITFRKDGTVGAYKADDFVVHVKLNPADYGYNDLDLTFGVTAPAGYVITPVWPSLSPGMATGTDVPVAATGFKLTVKNAAGTAVDLPSDSTIEVTIDVRVKQSKVIATVDPATVR